MAEQRHLKNAPITEAIIDIRVKLPDEFEIHQFEPIKKKLKTYYPIFEKQRAFKSKHEIKDGKPTFFPFEEMGIQGYIFKTNDKVKIAQFRLNGFTYNQLKPYTEWQDIFDEAKKLWSLYNEVGSPEAITRLAVRYINHLKLPLPIKDFGEFLASPPIVPEGLPQGVAKFLNRIVIVDDESEVIANVTQASDEKGSDNDHLNVILDIDVYKQVDFESESEEIWDIFKKLREMKNKIFFKSITEKTVRLFE